MPRNIKLVLEYDGAAFHGFQKQPNRPSIQEALESAFLKLFGKPIKISSASGRTDAGVHADCQVVNFKCPSAMPAVQIQKALNAHLPDAIVVKSAEEVNKNFHARFSAKSKVYEYRIWNSRVRSPLLAAQTYHVPYPLNLAKMKRAAKILTGKHDFRSFCTAGKVRRENTVRTMKRIQIKRSQGGLISIQFEADGFLYRMVRNLVGLLLDAGRGKIDLGEVQKVLAAKDRREAGQMVPAHGLRLSHVTY